MKIILGQVMFGSEHKNKRSVFQLVQNDKVLHEFAVGIIDWDALGPISNVLDQINELEIGYFEGRSIDFVRYFPNLESVAIKTSFVDSVSPLQQLSKLKRLSLERIKYPIQVVGTLQSLEELYLDNWYKGASSIFELRDLKKLGIQKYGFPDFQKAAEWTQLENLWLNAGKLENLQGISRSITRLRLTSLRKLSNINSLSDCKKLEDLRIQGCKQLNTLKGIEGCKNLKALTIANVGELEDIDPIADLENLEYLYISRSVKIRKSNVEVFNRLSKLNTLIITKTSGLTHPEMFEANKKADKIRITS